MRLELLSLNGKIFIHYKYGGILMKHRIVLSVFTIAMMAGAASFVNAETGVPDLTESYIEMAYTGLSSPVLFNVPNGEGSAFTEALTLDGVVDATITLYLRDEDGDPVANFPTEDMWPMLGGFGGLAFCTNGTIADSKTDNNGVTTWVEPLIAGGWSEGQTVVMIGGIPLESGGLDLRHNSPDLDGNGFVNLSDVSDFAYDFYRDYAFRSDLFYDGEINLSDVPRLAQNFLADCR
jgi:hypothetical protein